MKIMRDTNLRISCLMSRKYVLKLSDSGLLSKIRHIIIRVIFQRPTRIQETLYTPYHSLITKKERKNKEEKQIIKIPFTNLI